MTGFIHFKDLAGGSVGNSQSLKFQQEEHIILRLRQLLKINL